MDCYICDKKYKSWDGLFYHKRKVHNCTDVHSSRYELELKIESSIKPVKKEAPKCILGSKHSYDKEKIEVHYWKVHRGSFKWIECKIDRGRYACDKVREDEFKDHMRHNTMYSKEGSRYYMEPEKLEDLFNTEHLDVVQAMLVGLRAVEEKRLEERLECDREHSKLMASRPSTIERGSFSGEILGCR